MSRFYDKHGNVQLTLPKKDGKGLRKAHMGDAKKHGWVASVSTICQLVTGGSEALVNWKIRQYLDAAEGTAKLLARDHETWKSAVRKKAEKKMSEAPALGTAVHDVCEHFHRIMMSGGDLDGLKKKDEAMWPYIAAIYKFSQAYKIQATAIEKCVFIEAARSAGKVDFVGEVDGVPAILDYKTQKVRSGKPVFYASFPLQLAAYWKGLGSKGRIGSVIIDTSGHDEYDVTKNMLPAMHLKWYDNPLDYYQHFLWLSKIYYKINNWPETK